MNTENQVVVAEEVRVVESTLVDELPETMPEPNVEIFLHNDESTTPQFVQRVLMVAFGIDAEDAENKMFAAHDCGQATVKVCPAKQAAEEMEAADKLIKAAMAGDLLDFHVPNDSPDRQSCELKFTAELVPAGGQ